MKILITGISGFIGQHLTERLKDKYEIHGLYEHKESFKKNDIEHQHLCNLKDKEGLEKLVAEVQPDFVIHLAAKTEVALSFENYAEVSEVNYVGTVNLAEANRRFNPNLKAFLMASTMETYGHHPKEDGAFTEETEQKPMAPYAVAKLACEKYLEYMEYAYDFPYIILRQTNAYGRTDNDFFVVERIITQMLGGDVCNLGEPEPYRNFLFIDDLVDLYELLLERHGEVLGEVFVTGPDNAIKIGELADMCRKIIGWEGTINWHTIPKRPGEIYYLNSNPRKARELLYWEPKVDLPTGLQRTISIWSDRIEAWKKQK